MKETPGEGRGRGGESESLWGCFCCRRCLSQAVVLLMTALCVQERGVDSKAVCAVLLSDLLRFFLPLLLPCANMEERRGEREMD